MFFRYFTYFVVIPFMLLLVALWAGTIVMLGICILETIL